MIQGWELDRERRVGDTLSEMLLLMSTPTAADSFKRRPHAGPSLGCILIAWSFYKLRLARVRRAVVRHQGLGQDVAPDTPANACAQESPFLAALAASAVNLA